MKNYLACVLAAVAVGTTASAEIDVFSELLPAVRAVTRGDGAVEAATLAAPTVVTGTVPGAPAEVADQAYALDVTPTGATIVAGGPAGARYARVTLAQLANLGGGRVPCCRIVDWPRLKWRGFMNDCGKNFLPMEGLYTLLDVMARYKMNLFHWHLTDYQGWRLESKRYPALQRADAFTRQVGKFYTQDDFRALVAYARERGITVVPELDVPGHTLAFRTAMGIDTMRAPGTEKIVADLFEELCTLADAETMPFVHLGTDEARLPAEKYDPAWPDDWARTVNRRGRRAVVWAPGIRLAKDCDVLEMAWHDAYVTNTANDVIDCSRMYHASWDPFDVLSHAAFTRPCRWKRPNDRMLGAITCCWHDDNIGDDTMKRFRECMMLPAIVGMAGNFWTGDAEDRPEFIKRLPLPGTPAFARAAALERRMVAQRDRNLADVKEAFPFVAQTRMRWRVTDGETGKVLATDVPQATVWAYNYRTPANAIVSNAQRPVVFETWIRSPDDRVVSCWIDCLKVHGEYGRDGVARMPARGEWTAEGATVKVNGEPVEPPAWKQPGLAAREKIDVLERDVPYMNDLLETPLVDELFALRAPTPVKFRRGWNHVCLTLPRKEKRLRQSTGMTFCPIEGTSEHPREVADFEYAAVPPLHAVVQRWGDALVRGPNPATAFADIPVAAGHFYRLRTSPAVAGALVFLDARGKTLATRPFAEKAEAYPPAGATAAAVTLASAAKLTFYEDPERPVVPTPDPNRVAYDDRPAGAPTDRFQRAIDALSAAGGVVTVPAGVWHVKPLVLKSNVTLELSDGAVLLASVDPDDYDPLPRRRAFVYAEAATNVTIRGAGALDGRGYAFRERGKNMTGASQPQTLPKLMCFDRCRNVTLEDFTYRRGGAWGCHLRNCDGVTMRRVTCFNHVNNTNDGVDIESRNVLIEDCDIDADDDAVAIKAESDPSFAISNVVIRNCRLASMAYPFKIGTGSYGDVRDVLVENCRFPRTKMNHRFAWSKLSIGITNDVSGICGIGVQCVDGGRLENVTVRDVDIEGYNVPISVRLGRRHAPAAGRETYLRNVLIENVRATAEGPTASSICGVPGLRPTGVTLRHVTLELAGGAERADAEATVFENEAGYPSPTMFRSVLPACGLYVRHAADVKLVDVTFRRRRPDARPNVVVDDLTATTNGSTAQTEPTFANLIAHRGESHDAPENTLPAYRTAVERGFGFECDVYLSADGRVFTFHDGTLKRTSGGRLTKRCNEASWETEVSTLNVGGWGPWKGSTFDPTRPALLEEVCALARDGRWIYCEVKGGNTNVVPAIAKVLAAQKTATPSNFLFIAFSQEICAALKRTLPAYRCYWLKDAYNYTWFSDRPPLKGGPVTPEQILATLLETGADGVDVSFDEGLHTPAFIRQIHAAGYGFHVWTIDDPRRAREAFRRGVDTVTTNCAKHIRETVY